MQVINTDELINTGKVILVNGDVIFIEQVQYSPDGESFWEDSFIGSKHYSAKYGVWVEGHKYRRIKSQGKEDFDEPHKLVAEDGSTPDLRVLENVLQWKHQNETETDWKNLLDFNTLKGEKGATGDIGRGLNIDIMGFFDEFTVGYTGGFNATTPMDCGCERKSGHAMGETSKLFLSVGDTRYYSLTSNEINGSNLI